MLKVYGSDHCPDCTACKAAFGKNGIEYEYINITGSMRDLKAFLKLRDTDPVFDDIKKAGGVGIPAILTEDGTITLDWEKVLSDRGIQAISTEKTGPACRIDGSGC